MLRKVTAYIVFEDGTAQISEHKLRHGLPFAKSQMRQWIKEQSKKKVKSIEFLREEKYREIKDETV